MKMVIKKISKKERKKEYGILNKNKMLRKINIKTIIDIFPILLFLLIMCFYLLSVYNLSKNLESIPTCIYGCDYYFENGINIDYNNNMDKTWESSSHGWLGHINSLPKADAFLKSLVAKFTNYDNIDFWKNTLIYSYIMIIIGLISWFLLYNLLFSNGYISLFLTILSFNLTKTPYFKYSSIVNVFLPILIILLYLFDKKEIKNNKIDKKLLFYTVLLIIVIVLLSHIHSMVFFMTYIFLFFYYLFYFLLPFKKKDFNCFSCFLKAILERVKNIKSILLILVVIISMFINLLLGWWYRVFFVYKGQTNAFKFDVHTNLRIPHNYIFKTIEYTKDLFFNFSNLSKAIITILLLISILVYFIFKIKKSDNIRKFVFWISVSFLFSLYCYLITIPLLGLQLSPKHTDHFRPLFLCVLIGYLLYFIYYFLDKKYPIYKKYFNLILVLGIIFFSLNSVGLLINKFESNNFWQNGKHKIPQHYEDLAKFIAENNLEDDVFLSTNELSFAIHGISGVQLLTGRQSHFFIFGDFQKYWMDAAIIFYSNSSINRKEVLNKYYTIAKKQGRDLYLYWDYYWINSEWQQTKNGQIYPFDPLRFEDSKERRKILEENQIYYFVKKDSIFEPSNQNNPYATKLDILYISPQNYRSFEKPWNADLDNYLEEVWNYSYQGKEIAKLYKIKISS